jgi:hypothetical protein
MVGKGSDGGVGSVHGVGEDGGSGRDCFAGKEGTGEGDSPSLGLKEASAR